MAKAHCSVCDADVEAIDGVCMLGHPVGEPSHLDDLRDEVDRAFEDAAREVAAVLTGEIPVVPKLDPVPLARQTTQPLRLDTPILPEPPVVSAPTAGPAQVPTTYQAPSPAAPPPPPSRRLDVAGMWERANQAGNDDPINAFAPAPRLDWGPEDKKRLRRRIEG